MTVSLPVRAVGCLLLLLLQLSVPKQVHAASGESLDIVLVIDQSGSMYLDKYGKSDPLGLRWDAASMLIDLLSPQDRVGIVPFSIDAYPVFPELMPLDTQARREQLRDKMNEATDATLGPQTSYLKALSATRQLLSEGGNQRAVIFLTDGLPTDVSPDAVYQNPDLQWFREQNIPVYFLWLKNNSQTSDQATIEAVRVGFEETGPRSVQIDSPIDIAYAFARVLTDLQPGAYLDRLTNPVRDQPGKLRFEARASADQLLSEAIFIFVSNQVSGDFEINVTGSPQNTKSQYASGRAYWVIKTVPDGSTPIDGSWSVTTDAVDAIGFAFLRSDLKLELVYPTVPSQVLWQDENLLIGVRLPGVTAGQSPSLQASLIPGGCATRSSSQSASQVYPLQAIGLSTDNSIYWYEVPKEQVIEEVDEERLGIYVQLGQLDQPIRLGQCYDVAVQAGVADAVTIVKPTPSDPLMNGAIPVKVDLSPEVTWESVTAYFQAPDGKVQTVSLPPGAPEGVMKDVTQPGDHVVRVVAIGQKAGARVTLFRDTSYEVLSAIKPEKLTFDLGEVKTLGQVFTEVLTLSGAFISQATLSSFGPAAVFDGHSNQAIDESLVQVKLCDLPEIVEKRIECAVTITLSDDLPPGSYVVRVPMQQSDPFEDLGTATLGFTRPASRLLLETATTDLGMLEVTDSFLTSTLQFQGFLWEDDPQLPTQPELLKLRRTTDQVNVDDISLVEAEMTPQIGGTKKLTYDFVLRPDGSLLAGEYRAEFAVSPAVANLIPDPDRFIIEFEVPAPGVYLEFQRPSSDLEVWGLPMWMPLKREFLLPVIATTVNMTGAPALELPEVARVTSSDEKTLFPGTVEPVEWREMGAVEGKPNQYRYMLVLRVIDSLEQGDKLVTLRMPLGIQSEQEHVSPFTVWGGWRAWWIGGCPLTMLVLLGALVFSVSRARRKQFTGTLIFNGKLRGKPKLELNLADYKKYQSIEPFIKQGKWTAQKSTNQKALRIDCQHRDTIAVFHCKYKDPIILKKGHVDKWWTYH